MIKDFQQVSDIGIGYKSNKAERYYQVLINVNKSVSLYQMELSDETG